MVPRRHLRDLDPDLERVLAPFRAAGDRISARIEDDHGSVIATAGPDAASGHRALAEVVVHGEVAGRVIVAGRTSDPALLDAAAGSLASALGLAVAAHIDTAGPGPTPHPRREVEG